MFQTLGDRVSVLGIFKSGKLKPLRFFWKNKTFPISHITTTYCIKDGEVQKEVFAVKSFGNIYKLVYIPKDYSWILEEVFLEG